MWGWIWKCMRRRDRGRKCGKCGMASKKLRLLNLSSNYITSESKLESESGDDSESVWEEEIKEGSTLMWDGIHKIAIAFNEPLLH